MCCSWQAQGYMWRSDKVYRQPCLFCRMPQCFQFETSQTGQLTQDNLRNCFKGLLFFPSVNFICTTITAFCCEFPSLLPVIASSKQIVDFGFIKCRHSILASVWQLQEKKAVKASSSCVLPFSGGMVVQVCAVQSCLNWYECYQTFSIFIGNENPFCGFFFVYLYPIVFVDSALEDRCQRRAPDRQTGAVPCIDRG